MFKEKQKEPLLSEYMQEVIKHSRGDERNGAHVDYTIYLKQHIKQELLKDADILRTLHYSTLLGTKDELNGNAYLGTCIFDYMRLPDLKADTRNFICFEVEESHGNESLVDYAVSFRVVSHKDDVETDWGIPRMDILASIINKKFEWTNKFGKSFVKKSESFMIANNEYHVREIVYMVRVMNGEYHQMHGRTLGGYRRK